MTDKTKARREQVEGVGVMKDEVVKAGGAQNERPQINGPQRQKKKLQQIFEE
jgi:hypothetical protein